MKHHVVWLEVTNIFKELAASTFRVEETINVISPITELFTAMRTLNLIEII
jgi:hypothetical protein